MMIILRGKIIWLDNTYVGYSLPLIGGVPMVQAGLWDGPTNTGTTWTVFMS